MRSVTLSRELLGISETATVQVYETDRYGNPLNQRSVSIASGAPLALSLNTSTQTIKEFTTGKILASFSCYAIAATEGKSTYKTMVYPFDGEGEFMDEDILKELSYKAIYDVLTYKDNSYFVHEDFIAHFEAWLMSGATTYDAQYQDAFNLIAFYGSSLEERPTNYLSVPCINDLDVAIAKL